MSVPSPQELLQRAVALQRQGRGAEAIAAWRALLAVQPAHADAWYELAYLLRRSGEFEAALQAYAQSLACGVRDPHEVHLNRAVLYADHLRRDAEAEAELQAALRLKPDYRPAWLNLGNLHEERGRRDAALDCYARLLALPAGSPAEADLAAEALARSSQLRPPTGPDDPVLAQLEQAAARRDAAPEVRANLLFALGRACDRLGLGARAFAAFTDAQRWARHGLPPHDRARCEREFSALRDVFAERGAVAQVQPSQGASPLFICGMFRSGSTLVEQVLAAHPQLQPGGELELLPRLVAGPLAPFPAKAAALDAEALDELAADYRAQLRRLFPQRIDEVRYLSDKRPDNFRFIGLIKRLFPQAKIINTVRNPLDNGLSIFMQHLSARTLGYAGSLPDIGHYIGQYQGLMAHWRQLYAQDILDFDYDLFVREPRAQLERLLGFLGLPWHEDCLAFHRLDNTVKTASYWQVRRPLYGEASGRWRRYEAQLQPLRDALQSAGVALPA